MRKDKHPLYLCLHAIQTVPPSCLNRDDVGEPKTALYGGVRRARVSSQAWKRPIRLMMNEELEEPLTGVRTRMVSAMICDELRKRMPDKSEDDLKAMADDAIDAASIKGGGKDVLFLISRAQLAAVADAICEYMAMDVKAREKGRKIYAETLQAALTDNPSIDMLLFGRMVASNTSLSYDAACQVAHVISTHAVENEFDYFSAVDDYSKEDGPGAGHLGQTYFASSTMYRYAVMDIAELAKNASPGQLGHIAALFAKAFILAMPEGKKNSTAPQAFPDFVYASFRTDQPLNLVGAFERPVHTGNDGFSARSLLALEEQAQKMYANYRPDIKGLYIADSVHEVFGDKVSLDEMLKGITDYVSSHFPS